MASSRSRSASSTRATSSRRNDSPPSSDSRRSGTSSERRQSTRRKRRGLSRATGISWSTAGPPPRLSFLFNGGGLRALLRRLLRPLPPPPHTPCKVLYQEGGIVP